VIPTLLRLVAFAGRPLQDPEQLAPFLDLLDREPYTHTHFSFDEVSWFPFRRDDFLHDVERDCGDSGYALLARREFPPTRPCGPPARKP
jgi:hypothetical protein